MLRNWLRLQMSHRSDIARMVVQYLDM